MAHRISENKKDNVDDIVRYEFTHDPQQGGGSRWINNSNKFPTISTRNRIDTKDIFSANNIGGYHIRLKHLFCVETH